MLEVSSLPLEARSMSPYVQTLPTILDDMFSKLSWTDRTNLIRAAKWFQSSERSAEGVVYNKPWGDVKDWRPSSHRILAKNPKESLNVKKRSNSNRDRRNTSSDAVLQGVPVPELGDLEVMQVPWADKTNLLCTGKWFPKVYKNIGANSKLHHPTANQPVREGARPIQFQELPEAVLDLIVSLVEWKDPEVRHRTTKRFSSCKKVAKVSDSNKDEANAYNHLPTATQAAPAGAAVTEFNDLPVHVLELIVDQVDWNVRTELRKTTKWFSDCKKVAEVYGSPWPAPGSCMI